MSRADHELAAQSQPTSAGAFTRTDIEPLALVTALGADQLERHSPWSATYAPITA